MGTVVVVDDDPQCRDVICRMLTKRGAMLLPAQNGQDGLMILHQAHADLVITDLRMPIVGGEALCAAIRQSPSLSAIAILMMSSEPVTEAGAVEMQADAFLQKPFSSRQLLDACERALSRAALRRRR